MKIGPGRQMGKDFETLLRQWLREEIGANSNGSAFDNCMDKVAAMLVGEALSITDGNRSRAAKLLGLSRPTLHSKIEKYGLKIETSVTSKPS